MESAVMLKIDGLSKKFCKGLRRSFLYGGYDLFAELTGRSQGQELRKNEFWALQDVSFELRRGQTMGIIGSNGAGKSTLLKLINGLIKPNKGSIAVRGRIGSLIALGVGFNPILTGLENVYINAAVLGIPKREIDKKLDEILDFADIGDFIDTPVQNYSSGMKVRLGYSVAAHLNPDLLLIDEVLSVGDSSFRERCYRHLDEYRENGGTIVFISHNMPSVEAVCERVIWLDRGRVVGMGDPQEIIQQYEQKMLELSRRAQDRLYKGHQPSDENDIWFTDVQCCDLEGNPGSYFDFEEPFEVRLRYETAEELSTPDFVIGFKKLGHGGNFVSLVCSGWDGIKLETISKKGAVRCKFSDVRLSPGSYEVYVAVRNSVSSRLGKKWYMPYQKHASFTVKPGSLRQMLPGIPGAHIVSAMPPVVLGSEWDVMGEEAVHDES